jgi:SAM-dependent methyltransferase
MVGRTNEAAGEASPWVVRFAPLIARDGRVLDLACGGGRHVRFFLERGHRVTAIDRDLAGLRALCGDPELEVIEADLESSAPWPLEGRRFAAVVVTRYLHRPLLPAIVAAVDIGGILLYETFAAGNERFGRPSNPDFLLRPGELIDAVRDELRVLAYEDVIDDAPHPAAIQRIAARREPLRPSAARPIGARPPTASQRPARRSHTMRTRLAVLATLGVAVLSGQSLLGRPDVEVHDAGTVGKPPVTVYVQDFEIEAPLPPDASEGLPGPAGRILERVREGPIDPTTRRRNLVDEMASSIVADLRLAGWSSERISPDAPPPASGWLVRGVFTVLDTGNQLRRGAIGLGAGQSELELHVAIDDLEAGSPKPLYTIDASQSGSRGPGAGAMVKMNPYAAAAKFALSRHEPERDVAKTAAAIADAIARKATTSAASKTPELDPDAPPPPRAAP